MRIKVKTFEKRFCLVIKVYVEQFGEKISRDYFVRFKGKIISENRLKLNDEKGLTLPINGKLYWERIKKIEFALLVFYLRLRYAFVQGGEVYCDTYIEEFKVKERS